MLFFFCVIDHRQIGGHPLPFYIHALHYIHDINITCHTYRIKNKIIMGKNRKTKKKKTWSNDEKTPLCSHIQTQWTYTIGARYAWRSCENFKWIILHVSRTWRVLLWWKLKMVFVHGQTKCCKPYLLLLW